MVLFAGSLREVYGVAARFGTLRKFCLCLCRKLNIEINKFLTVLAVSFYG